MNYGVHALMYYYYYLTSLGYKQIWWASIVTILQISQMFIGICICLIVYYYQSSYSPYKEGCDVSTENLWAAFLMYSSYFMLFISFAIEKYILPVPSTKSGETKVNKDDETKNIIQNVNNQSANASATHTSNNNIRKRITQ